MTNEARFFDSVRAGLLGPTLSAGEVSGCSAILLAMDGAPLSWRAYALATAYKETAGTMQPIAERGGDAYFRRRYDPLGDRPDIAKQLGNTTPGDGVRFHGRGYVQLTGRRNYALGGKELGVDMVAKPELAMRADLAALVMRRGMTEGWFTGKSFASYLPATGAATRAQFASARRIINGTDCADEIAGYAIDFQKAVLAGGWA